MNRVVLKLIVGSTFVSYIVGSFVALFIILYIFLYTSFWWALVLYFVWVYCFDRDIPEKGGRRSEFLRSLPNWDLCARYLPHDIKFESDIRLNPNLNYLFACYPHGVLPVGTVLPFIVKRYGEKYFPYHVPYMTIVHNLFFVPLYREYVLAIGFCSSSAKSIRWILNKPNGGNILFLAVGGAQESYYCRPGDYHIILKNRKGFIKLALESGSALVPVISFGETDLFNQLGSRGSLLHKLQEFIRKYTGIAFVIPIGCGIFQDYFGLIPKQKPVTTVVGEPIHVEKVSCPSSAQIEKLHQTYTEQISNLFERNKHKYLKDSKNISLIIE